MSIPEPFVIGSDILIALGANLPGPYGSAENTIAAACRALENYGLVTRVSRIWQTAPIPASDQPWYRNAVIALETDLNAHEIFEKLKEIENEFGRTRHEKNEARILDLDLIAYRDEVILDRDLEVPHPRMHRRAFVLLPLQDIAPHWMHPVLQLPLERLIAELTGDQVATPLDSRSS